MSIVGGYSMDLYCENVGYYPDGIHPLFMFPVEFVGETRQECAREARQNGWILNFRKGTAICPLCSKKNKEGLR